MGAKVAEHELVTVRRRLRHPVAAGHTAGAAHIFDDDLLPQKLGKPGGQNAADRVCRATRRKRNDHGHWSGGPLLRLCSPDAKVTTIAPAINRVSRAIQFPKPKW